MNTERKFIAPSEKIFFHPDLIDDVRTRNPRIPRHFELDPTNRCNLACDNCHFAYTHGSAGDISQDMPMPLFEKVIEDMASNNVKAVTFTGGGEPLFNPNHLRMFQLTKEAGIQMGMYTNGVLLNGETAEFVAANFEWCYISLDAATPEDYQDYKKRGENVFWRNIDNIHNISHMSDRKATVGVGYLVGRHNLDKLAQDLPWLSYLGADYVQMRPLIDVGSYAEQKALRRMTGMAFETDDRKAWEEHYSWIPKAITSLNELRDIPRIDIAERKFVDLYNGKRAYTTCLSTSLTGSIGAKGEVWLCVNTRHTVGAKLGDLNTQTLGEIYSQKPIEITDLKRCRIMCRNDQLNQTLDRIDNTDGQLPLLNLDIVHTNFI